MMPIFSTGIMMLAQKIIAAMAWSPLSHINMMPPMMVLISVTVGLDEIMMGSVLAGM